MKPIYLPPFLAGLLGLLGVPLDGPGRGPGPFPGAFGTRTGIFEAGVFGAGFIRPLGKFGGALAGRGGGDGRLFCDGPGSREPRAWGRGG